MSKLKQIKVYVGTPCEYKLTKVSDDKFKGSHPNKINKDYSITGYFEKSPIIGESFRIIGKGLRNSLITSVVIEIVNEETFRTLNSTYKLEKCSQ